VINSAPVPWAVRVDAVNRTSYIVMFGVITFSDFVDAHDALAAAPSFDPALPLLIALRRASDVILTRDDMHRLMTIGAVAPATRRAVLVNDSGTLGIVQVYQSLRQTPTDAGVFRSCRTLEECAEWLGVGRLEL
jgi:hypothetical protein